MPVGGSVGGGDHGVRVGQPGIDVAHHIISARQDLQPAPGHSAPRTRRQSHSTCQDLQSQHLSIELPAHPPWSGKAASDRGHGLASTERWRPGDIRVGHTDQADRMMGRSAVSATTMATGWPS